jgi:UDP:flavonoid glycosyltransferase YjiC (YdhE family)
MRVTLVTIGSRGDVEPYVALGCALARAGHTVRVATSEPFGDFVRARGLDFVRLGGDIKHMVGDEGRAALAAAGSNVMRTFSALRRYLGPLIREALDALDGALSASDVVIGHVLVPGAASYARERGIVYLDAAYVPVLPTRHFAHPGAPVGTPRGIPSLLSHFVAEQILWQAFRGDVDAFRRRVLGLGASSFFGPHTLRIDRRPAWLFAFSPEVVAKPRDWPPHAFVTGYWFLDPVDAWTPPRELTQFLEAGEPPIYVGFGSMTAHRSADKTLAVLAALKKAGRRGLIATGWGGLTKVATDDSVMFIGDVPHAWLFPRVAAALHHGGAGTTAAAFRAGIPQMAIPFLADQPFWGHRIAMLGAGPEPLPIAQVEPDRLQRGLARLDTSAVRRAAAELGRRIRAERGAEAAVPLIEREAARARLTSSAPTPRRWDGCASPSGSRCPGPSRTSRREWSE